MKETKSGLYDVRTSVKGSSNKTSSLFYDIEEAITYFKQMDKMGFECALYNLN